jgi:hypothetical protein
MSTASAKPATKAVSWKVTSLFGDRKTVSHTVGGKEIQFGTIRVSTLLALRTIIPEAAKALSMILNPTQGDRKTTEVNRQKEGGGGFERIVELSETDLSVIRYRAQHNSEAWECLSKLLTSDDCRNVVASMIIESLAYNFEEGATPPTVEEFLADVDLPEFVDCIIGVFKANKDAFGPFGKAVEGWVGKVASAAVEAETPANPSEIPLTPGPDSKTT